MFEGEAERILWLPAITLGYVYTLSGSRKYFILAVIAIGGARLFTDIINSNLVEETSEGPEIRDDMLEILHRNLHSLKSWLFAIIAVGYVLSAIVAVNGLIEFFIHSNLILVALAATWAGAGLIVIMNL
jgi:hypothetical protein